MSGRLFKGTMAGLSLALAATAASVPAFAHGKYTGIRGTVAVINGSSVKITTKSGTATAQITSSTRFTRVAAGSVADVQPGTFVSVQFASGTTTVSAIRISPSRAASVARTAGGQTKATHHTHVTSGTATPRAPSTTRHAAPTTRTVRGGKVVQLANGKLTLQGRGTQTSTYTVAPTVAVTKFVSGQAGDLKTGETVEIMTDAAGNALAVVISGA